LGFNYSVVLLATGTLGLISVPPLRNTAIINALIGNVTTNAMIIVGMFTLDFIKSS
jgi:hypothetical protein